MAQNFENKPVFTADDFNAYADGLMDHARVAQFEAFLAENPLEAEKIADIRAINRSLAETFDPVLTEPVPERLLSAVSDPKSHVTAKPAAPKLVANTNSALRIAASMAWLTVGLGIGWYANSDTPAGSEAFARLSREAQTAFAVYSPEQLHPVEVSADRSAHLSTWLSNRLGRDVPIPSLADLGYAFLGGRLLTGYQQPAAMLMYQNAEGERLIFYVSIEFDPKNDSPMTYDGSQTAGVVTWVRDGTGFGVSGDYPEETLIPAANLIKAQISA